jgi:transposase
MQIARIGLELAKYVFEIHGVDARGKTVARKTLCRHAVLAFFANLPPEAYPFDSGSAICSV